MSKYSTRYAMRCSSPQLNPVPFFFLKITSLNSLCLVILISLNNMLNCFLVLMLLLSIQFPVWKVRTRVVCHPSVLRHPCKHFLHMIFGMLTLKKKAYVSPFYYQHLKSRTCRNLNFFFSVCKAVFHEAVE